MRSGFGSIPSFYRANDGVVIGVLKKLPNVEDSFHLRSLQPFRSFDLIGEKSGSTRLLCSFIAYLQCFSTSDALLALESALAKKGGESSEPLV